MATKDSKKIELAAVNCITDAFWKTQARMTPGARLI